MYKKITHTIIEEHFDCPEAVDIAVELENGNGNLLMKFQAVQSPMVMPASQFKTKIRELVMDLDSRWQTLLNATFDTAYDYEAAIEDAFVTSNQLGDLLKSYYGVEFGERLNQHWRSAAMTLLYSWRNVKSNFDNSVQKENLLKLSPVLAQVLNQYNSQWDRTAVTNLSNEWLSAYVALAEAIKAKNAAAQTKNKSTIASDINQFSNILSDGVIQQFPSLFT